MSLDAALYQQFDPRHPLEADEEDLYVDWQQELGPENLKLGLARSIARTGAFPICRLFTGHRGAGKTTELKRVERMLEQGRFGRKLFVSFLEAERWMDLNDVAPGDIVLHIARQLIDDLKEAGFECAMTNLEQFFLEVRDILKQDVTLKTVQAPGSLVELGAVLKDVPIARSVLRGLFQGHLPTIYHLINEVILKQAREWLRKPAHGGFADILVIVDELDRIPQRVLKEQDLTNHENLFVGNARVLKFLNCDVLYTIPLALAYSGCREQLKGEFSEILTLPLIPVRRHDGQDFERGLATLRKIVELRCAKEGATLDQLFAARELLGRLCRLSGGHVRNLFILLRSAMDRCDHLPINRQAVELTVRRQAIDISLAIRPRDWEVLRQVHRDHRPVEEPAEVWNGLLRNLLVFPYEDADGLWYDWNPLVGEAPGGGS